MTRREVSIMRIEIIDVFDCALEIPQSFHRKLNFIGRKKNSFVFQLPISI